MTCITSADTLSPREARRPLFCKSSRGLTMIFRFTTMGVAKRLHLHDFGQGRRLGQIHRLLDVGQSDSRTAVECARQIANGVFQITISLDTLLACLHLRDVAAGAKGAARPAQDQNRNARILGSGGNRTSQRPSERRIERVQRRGPVHGEEQDTAVAALEQDSFGHALTPREYWRPPCEES